jgi:flagellar basal-body rod protein FlgG
MLNGIIGTLGGKSANERRLEIVANNIANALTPGFKASRPVVIHNTYGDSNQQDQVQATSVNVSDSYVHFSDAPLVETGSVFDLALEGAGFFVVQTPQGNMYTRNGQFSLNQDKKLVTMSGNFVVGESGGEITIDGRDVRIETDGTIFVDKVRVDRIKVADFKSLKELRNFGMNLFVNTDSNNVEVPAEAYTVKQGFYEASNVDIMKEMVEMINALRAYESYSKVDQSFNELMGKLIDLGRI